jgi:hypothetical protein
VARSVRGTTRSNVSWVRKGKGWGIAPDRLSSWFELGEIRRWWRSDPLAKTWTERRLLTEGDALRDREPARVNGDSLHRAGVD